jgi:hypothetical protein
VSQRTAVRGLIALIVADRGAAVFDTKLASPAKVPDDSATILRPAHSVASTLALVYEQGKARHMLKNGWRHVFQLNTDNSSTIHRFRRAVSVLYSSSDSAALTFHFQLAAT